ncbi:7068_t:CDS:1 [Ambispora gerdemannii]|uniref:7068_t:CDS:1 n=1 Tax=Ambispora gerdemannii TaxID=144530 RepID=A0A9N8ZDC2_9GLOM|nr:7068_t:CDS:1 [Ambispora gerdemannii]
MINNDKNNRKSSCKKNIDIPISEIISIREQLQVFPLPYTCDELYENGEEFLKGTDGETKRPPNCYILFRKVANMRAEAMGISHSDQRYWSVVTSKIWKMATKEQMNEYKKLSEDVCSKHKAFNPQYRFKPNRAKANWKNFDAKNYIHKTSKKRKTGKSPAQTGSDSRLNIFSLEESSTNSSTTSSFLTYLSTPPPLMLSELHYVYDAYAIEQQQYNLADLGDLENFRLQDCPWQEQDVLQFPVQESLSFPPMDMISS